MAVSTPERVGVMVIRVWFEPGAGGGLRARMTGTLDLETREQTVTVSASPEGIADVVLAWLGSFISAATGVEVTER
jgi:hypothetical protein